jgi:RimJ/RimL family protein N-acetyltransferase
VAVAQRHPSASTRLFFRCWQLDDIDLARGLWGDPKVSAKIAREPLDEAAVAERLRSEITCELEHGVQYWPIFARADGEHVGSAGLKPYDLARGVYELGFHVRSELWARGFATEAARAVIDFAFDELGAAALFAGHHPDNTSSARVLEKLGFRYTYHELYPPTGLPHPSYLLALSDYRRSAIRSEQRRPP